MPFRGSTSTVTRQQLRARRYVRVFRDVYEDVATGLDLELRMRAAVLAVPDAVACLWTAARLLKLPVDDHDVLHVVRREHLARSKHPGITVYRLPLDDDEVYDLRGLRVTDGPRTFVDLAAHLTLEQLVAVGDVVVRRWSAPAVEQAVARRKRRPGLVLARLALPLLDPGSDSPGETRTRLRLHAAGYTRMRHGVQITDEGGGWLAEPDLADDKAQVAVQYDGDIHFTRDKRQRRQDVNRDELSRQQNWEVVVATAIDDAEPYLLLEKVEAAYRRRARLCGPDVLPEHLR